MPEMQNLNYLFCRTVDNDIRRADKLTCSLHFSRPASCGEGGQPFYAVNQPLSDAAGGCGIVLLDVLHSGFQLVGCFGCPPNLPHEWNSLSMRFTTS